MSAIVAVAVITAGLAGFGAARALRPVPLLASALVGALALALSVRTADLDPPFGLPKPLVALSCIALAGAGVGVLLGGLRHAAAQRVQAAGTDELPRLRFPLRWRFMLCRDILVHVDVVGLALHAGLLSGSIWLMAALGDRRLTLVSVLALFAANGVATVAHEAGHLIAGRRHGWAVHHVWIGAANHVRFAHEDIPTRTTSVMAVAVAGPVGGTVATTLAALGALVLVDGLTAALIFGVAGSLHGLLQLVVGGDGVILERALRQRARGVRVVTLDAAFGLHRIDHDGRSLDVLTA